MIKILSLTFLLFTSLVFAQNQAQMASQEIAEANYKRQLSNAAFEKAVGEMRNSADKSAVEEANRLNDDFELNFAEKKKIEGKITAILQKIGALEEKLSRAKPGADTSALVQKIESLNLELEKQKKKSAQNEAELKTLQQSYRNLKNHKP
ncbi:hypothetical protein FIC_00840 [Flavobacteriaceae bacterium 3519-10]|nr:hypothetical protein FIC_00840 [Flavobacteriaceae bacterium 3519-10]